MKFDFFGEVPERDITRLMHLIDFVADGCFGQKGYVSPEYFFWGESLGDFPCTNVLQRELRLLGNALVAHRYRPNKRDPYLGHVVEIRVAKSGVFADFSMVENLNLDASRKLNGSSIEELRKHFGSVGAIHLNLESLA